MKFQDMPESIQVIAARLLAEKIQLNDDHSEKKPVITLAQEVKDAFTALYSLAENSSARNDSD